jgi:hypothetical protein
MIWTLVCAALCIVIVILTTVIINERKFSDISFEKEFNSNSDEFSYIKDYMINNDVLCIERNHFSGYVNNFSHIVFGAQQAVGVSP